MRTTRAPHSPLKTKSATSSAWISNQNGEDLPVYEVVNGEIEIKGKKYPIKLPDGYYVIRKLTPTECERLQTLPDGYTSAVSATQRYRGLGNGWTAEVIIHILAGVLKDVPRDEEIVVLSMYDGIGTGRYCLDKMGFTNVTYYASANASSAPQSRRLRHPKAPTRRQTSRTPPKKSRSRSSKTTER